MNYLRAFLFQMAAACAILFVSCSLRLAGTETGNGTAGIVLGTSGKPVAGARVELVPVDYNALDPSSSPLPICSTQTDANGGYCFYRLQGGCYNLFCDSGANGAYLDSLKLSGDYDDTIPAAVLKKSGSISGSAFVSSGRFISSVAFFTIIGSKLIGQINQHSGKFTLPSLAMGKYRAEIIAQDAGYFQQQVALHIDEGRADTIEKPFFLVSSSVTALLCDSSGVWVGAINGLAHVHNGFWRAYGLTDGLSSSKINCLYDNGNGITWAGTSLRLACIKNDTLTEKMLPQNIPGLSNITALAGDSLGNIWVGTPQGLFMYNGAGVARVTGNDALTDVGLALSRNDLSAISAILCLRGETIVGTLHGAYVRDSVNAWREIPEMSALAVTSILLGGGATVWFGTNQGVRSWNYNSRVMALPFDGQETGAVTCLTLGNNDSLYIGGANGLFVGRDSGVTKIDLDKSSVSVTALSRDSDGVIWAGTNDGILVIERGGIREIR